MNSWQKTLDARLAEILEAIGVDRPLEGARAMRGALRGFELERLIRPAANGRELRRRLEVVLAGLLQGTGKRQKQPRPASRSRARRAN